MPIAVDSTPNNDVLRVRASGRLTRQDYLDATPRLEEAFARRGKLRILCDMCGLQGWDLGAAWEDFRVGSRHLHDYERIAMVGDRPWQKWIATLFQPLMSAPMRYFDRDASQDAEAWISAPTVPDRPPDRRWVWLAVGGAVLLGAGLWYGRGRGSRT